MSLRHRCRRLERCHLIVVGGVGRARGEAMARLLSESNVELAGVAADLVDIPVLRHYLSLVLPLEVHSTRAGGGLGSVDVVVCHHEQPGFLRLAVRMAEETGSRSVAILQLPPFYGDAARARRIAESYRLFYELARRYAGVEGLAAKVYYGGLHPLRELAERRLLESYLSRLDLVLAVSPSIPLEMGEPWSDRVVAMRYWAGVDEDLVGALRRWRALRRPSGDLVSFAARVVPSKGVGDLLLAWRLVRRWSRRRARLLVLGKATLRRRRFIEKVARGLGIEDSVVVAGYVGGDEFWRLRASSTLMIYPSHEDSYSYSVFESLMMGVPVVAYDIPALRLSYEGSQGLHLVPEGDVEALAQRAVEVLEKPGVVEEEPFFKTWSEVAREEEAVLRAVAARGKLI
ncbi:MAG: glycosyltransferase [Acidilobaceae archaeon]